MRIVDRTGHRYGRLLVLGQTIGSYPGETYWLCRCDCGRLSTPTGKNLKKGRTKSCGCGERESRAKLMALSTTHGRTRTAEYRSWIGAKKRCHNPKDRAYARYGGRGLAVAPEWRDDFEAFFRDMGPKPSSKHSLDRIDNNRGYEPGNCRWATAKEQARNMRVNRAIGQFTSVAEAIETLGVNRGTAWSRIIRGGGVDSLARPVGLNYQGRLLTFNGETLSVAGWARRLGLAEGTIHARIRYNWPLERALTEPSHRKRPKVPNRAA